MQAPLPCPHRPPCPGCPRYGEPGPSPAAAAAIATLARDAGLAPPEPLGGAPLGFRHRARLMVRGRSASPKIGLFQAGTHRIVDVPRCLVHHPLVNRVAAALRDAVRTTGVAPYSDRAHRGLLRAVQVVVERTSQTAQVVLVTCDDTPDAAAPLAEALRHSLAGALHSLWWNGQPERSNAILGRYWQHWEGPEAVCERVGGARIHFPPGAFGQSHLALADRVAAEVAERVPAGARVVEYYAGCGPLGLGLLGRSRAVTFVESHPDAVRGLRLGVADRPAAERARATVVAGGAGAEAARAGDADAVIADPPRKGLAPELLDALCRRPPRRLLYLACGLDRFVIQARRLLEAGVGLGELRLYALFPHTDHAEVLGIFSRA